jgi:hypothetical protein
MRVLRIEGKMDYSKITTSWLQSRIGELSNEMETLYRLYGAEDAQYHAKEIHKDELIDELRKRLETPESEEIEDIVDYESDDDDYYDDDDENDYCDTCGHQTVYSFEEGGRICYKHGLQ